MCQCWLIVPGDVCLSCFDVNHVLIKKQTFKALYWPLILKFIHLQFKRLISFLDVVFTQHCLYSTTSYSSVAAVWALEDCFEQGGMFSVVKKTDGTTT